MQVKQRLKAQFVNTIITQIDRADKNTHRSYANRGRVPPSSACVRPFNSNSEPLSALSPGTVCVVVSCIFLRCEAGETQCKRAESAKNVWGNYTPLAIRHSGGRADNVHVRRSDAIGTTIPSVWLTWRWPLASSAWLIYANRFSLIIQYRQCSHYGGRGGWRGGKSDT